MKNFQVVFAEIYGLQIIALGLFVEFWAFGNAYLLPFGIIDIIFLMGWRCELCGSSPADKRTIGLVFPFFTVSFRRCGVCGSENPWKWKFKSLKTSYTPPAAINTRMPSNGAFQSRLVRWIWIICWGIGLSLIAGFLRIRFDT